MYERAFTVQDIARRKQRRNVKQFINDMQYSVFWAGLILFGLYCLFS